MGMGELANCPVCGDIFVKTKFRDTCEKCYKEEEEKFETAYAFIRKRENRTATMDQVIEGTGVEEDLIMKFIKTGRLKTTQFPNLKYPCSRCGKPTNDGDLCETCTASLRDDLKLHESEQDHRRRVAEKEKADKAVTYYAVDEKYRR